MIYLAIEAERQRQRDLAASGNWSWRFIDRDDAWRFIVLAEEVGEVARAICDEEPRDRLRAELIQVAAVCVQWLEVLTGDAV